MCYSYKEQKPYLFTDEGQQILLKVRDNVIRLLEESGAFMMYAAWRGVGGDAWQLLACVDRLVELGEIIECVNPTNTWGQDRIFIKKPV